MPPSRFEQLDKFVFEEVDGAFQCSDCFATATEAKFYPEGKILKFTCPNGHNTAIEDFKL